MGKPNDPQGITEDRKMNPEIKQFVDAEEKRMYSEESRTEMADAGAAMPDGSYPIKDEADLRNAIQAFGRAKDPEATKAHIKKRAAALDLENLIPDNWNDSEEGMDDSKSAEGVEEKAAVAIGCPKVQFRDVADDVVHICVVVPTLSAARWKR